MKQIKRQRQNSVDNDNKREKLTINLDRFIKIEDLFISVLKFFFF